MTVPSRVEEGWRRRDSLACFSCILVGSFLAILPHLATLVRYGTLEFLADNDDLIYLAVSRAPYYGEPSLRDPFCGRWENVPCLYSRALFAPFAWMARQLGLPLILTSLVWRGVGGSMMGLALFVIFRRVLQGIFRPTMWALGCALVCLADAGFIAGRSIVQDITLLPHLLSGTTPLSKPDALPQYRVVTPLLDLPFLLLLAASMLPIGRRHLRDAIGGIAALGVCCLFYFFFWTASVLALGMYLSWWILRAWTTPTVRHAALRETALTCVVLAGGVAIGLPQVAANAKTFRDPKYQPILERMYKPIHVERGDPVRRWYVKNLWACGKLAVGAIGMLLLRSPALGLLWCFTLAGYALANSALVTGLEFENFHWLIVSSTIGQIMLMATLVLFVDHRGWLRAPWIRAAWILPVLLLAVALAWRPYEALHAPESAKIRHALASLKPLQTSLAALDVNLALAGPEEAKIAILFSRAALLYSSPYSWTTLIPDDVVHERHALNGWLQGMDLSTYMKLAEHDTNADMFPRPQWEPGVVGRMRGDIFESLVAHPDSVLLKRYRPDYLLLPRSASPPERAGPWSLVRESGAWTLWTRRRSRGSS